MEGLGLTQLSVSISILAWGPSFHPCRGPAKPPGLSLLLELYLSAELAPADYLVVRRDGAGEA